MRNVSTIDIPLSGGVREDIDDAVFPVGPVKSMKNLRLRKGERWGVRGDYTALGTTLASGTLVAYDLYTIGDRLFSIGTTSNENSNSEPLDVFEYVNTSLVDWKATDPQATRRISPVSSMRQISTIPTITNDVTRADVAADASRVCMVYESNSDVYVVLIDASTYAVLATHKISSRTNPRVVGIGDTFFIASQTGEEISLHRLDENVDSSPTAITSAFATGATISDWDMCLTLAGTGFFVAVARSTSLTIREFDSAGAMTGSDTTDTLQNIPFALSVAQSTNRIHVAATENDASFDDTYLYSYTGGTRSPASATLVDLGGGGSTQPVIGVDGARVSVYCQDSSSAAAIIGVSVDDDDHGNSVSGSLAGAYLSSKPITTTSGDQMVCVQPQTSSGLLTSHLFEPFDGVVCATRDVFTAGQPDATRVPGIAVSGTKAYWLTFLADSDGVRFPALTELTLGTSRRQAAELGGQLHFSGGIASVFDTRGLAECGFPVVPRLTASATSGGSMTASSTYLVVALLEWYDSTQRLHRSQLTDVSTVTLGVGDSKITGTVFPGYSVRANFAAIDYGGDVRVVIYRSEANRNILKRAATYSLYDASFSGASISYQLTESDASIAGNEIVYTQSGRAALGNILEHEAPVPFSYVVRAGRRLYSAGLPEPSKLQVSKELFPGEAVQWSGDIAYFVDLPDEINGLASLDTVVIVFSRDSVYSLQAAGPNDAGEGEIPQPIRLPTSTGLKDWRSVVESPLGVHFQGDDDKLWLLPRGGGAPQSFGDPIEDTLASFPEVVGSMVSREEQLVSFLCVNSGNTDSRLLSYDIRSEVWCIDEFDGSTPSTSAVSYNGRIARIQSGVVYTEDSDVVPTAFIDHGLTTGTIRPFKENGWGRICWFLLLGEFRGNCVVTARISYDDGASFTTLSNAFTLTTSEYTAGDRIRLQWYPERRKGDRFQIDIQVTQDIEGTASEGLAINNLTIGVQGNVRGGPRLPSAQKG